MLPATTTNQIPSQSNTANGDNNRLQNCAQTAAGKQNHQPLDCQQNSIQEDTEETRGIALLTVIKEVVTLFFRQVLVLIHALHLPI